MCLSIKVRHDNPTGAVAPVAAADASMLGSGPVPPSAALTEPAIWRDQRPADDTETSA